MSGLVVVRTHSGSLRPIPAGQLRVNRVRRQTAGISGRMHELNPGAGISLKGLLGGIGRAAVGFVTGGVPGAVAGVLGGGGGGTSAPTGSPPPLNAGGSGLGSAGSTSAFAPSTCPEGFRVNPTTGVCEKAGFGGAFERMFPGGQTGTLAPAERRFGPDAGGHGGTVVLGAFGTPAMLPVQVGSITGRNGTRPILRCNPGLVLGRDDLCYPVQVIGARGKWRKHPRAAKPPITVGDVQAIRRAASAQNRVKNLAKSVGLTMQRKPARAAPKRKR